MRCNLRRFWGLDLFFTQKFIHIGSNVDKNRTPQYFLDFWALSNLKSKTGLDSLETDKSDTVG